MKLTLAAVLLCALGTSAFADDTCFDVSADGKAWSKTPELLCVSNVKDADYTLSLKTGIAGSQHEIVTLHLNLLTRARCVDCNKDVFGVANPTNSIANALQVKFDGKRAGKTTAETGTVKIGATRLFYRSTAGAAAPIATVPAKGPAAPTTIPAVPATAAPRPAKSPTPPPAKPAGPPRGDTTMSPPTHAPAPQQ